MKTRWLAAPTLMLAISLTGVLSGCDSGGGPTIPDGGTGAKPAVGPDGATAPSVPSTAKKPGTAGAVEP
jgi:hypothetical protein